MKRLLASAFTAGLLARALQFAMAAFLAHDCGVAGFGEFVFVVGAALVVAQVAALGWPTLSQKYVAAYWQSGELELLRGFLPAAYLTVAGVAVGLAAIAWLLVPATASLVMQNLLFAFWLAIPLALRKVARQQLIGFGRPGQGISVDEVCPPLAVVAVLSLPGDSTPSAAISTYGLASLAAMLWGVLRMAPAATPPRLVGVAQLAAWSREGVPMMLGGAARVALARSDVLMLAPMATFTEVGLYGAAYRLTHLLTFPQVMITTVLGPRVSAAARQRQRDAMRRLQQLAYGAAIVISGPLVLLLIAFREPVLDVVYGEAFLQAAAILAVLALAQGLCAITIPLGNFMVMSGAQSQYLRINASGLALNLVLNLLLIPRYGALGAALALILTNLGIWLAKHWTVRMLLDREAV